MGQHLQSGVFGKYAMQLGCCGPSLCHSMLGKTAAASLSSVVLSCASSPAQPAGMRSGGTGLGFTRAERRDSGPHPGPGGEPSGGNGMAGAASTALGEAGPELVGRPGDVFSSYRYMRSKVRCVRAGRCDLHYVHWPGGWSGMQNLIANEYVCGRCRRIARDCCCCCCCCRRCCCHHRCLPVSPLA